MFTGLNGFHLCKINYTYTPTAQNTAITPILANVEAANEVKNSGTGLDVLSKYHRSVVRDELNTLWKWQMHMKGH